MPPQFEMEKVFPQRGYLCLRRLVKRATFNMRSLWSWENIEASSFCQGQMGRTYVQWLLWLSTF